MAPPTFDDAFRARFCELVEWRRDVRRFRREPLPRGTVERLIDIACGSPSVGLSQPWRFVMVDCPVRRTAIRANFEASNHKALLGYADDRARLYARLKLAGLDDAPHHLAVFADRHAMQGHGLGRATMPDMIEFSVVAAITTLLLAARAQGIGTGWISILDPIAAAGALDVPPQWRLIAYLCLGYAQADDNVPMLEREGWEQRKASADFIFRR